MGDLINYIMDRSEIIIVSITFISLICYLIDGFIYKKQRKKLIKSLQKQTVNQQDINDINQRFHFLSQKQSQKNTAEEALFLLTQNQPLSNECLKLLNQPAYFSEKLIHYFSDIFWLLFVLFAFRSFLYEPFRIPSGSMEPTLQNGDFIAANKFIYGIRMPITNKKIISISDPKRGDVVVFLYPNNPKVRYIKRIIGLPNDKITIKNGRVAINGKEQELTISSGKNNDFNYFTEKLGDKNHQVQFIKNIFKRITKSGEVVVPEGHYFVMGDNRDQSEDSRFWGFVPESNLVGKAQLIWMNLDCVTFRGNCSRIGTFLP